MILNFKELASDLKNIDGRVVQNNTLMRSAYIEPNKENQAFLIEKRVDSIFDFRSEYEIENEPNFTNFDVRYYPLGKVKNAEKMKSNIIKFQVSDMIDFYAEGIQDCQYLKQAVRDIVINPRNVLFHCTAGKDRTGMFGCVIMLLLDFDLASCKKHYLLIDPLFIKLTKKKLKDRLIDLNDQDLEDILTVKSEYFDAFINGINNEYGSIENYLSTFDITNEQLNKFKQYYLK